MPTSGSRSSAAAFEVAERIACSGDMPHSTMRTISTSVLPCGLNGVPASVPHAILTPVRSERRNPSRASSTSAVAFSTAYAGTSSAWSTMPRIAEIVGTWNVPRSFISRAPSAESIEPCSIESTPARIARTIPSGPIACAPTTRLHECASSTAASSSSCVNAVKSWVIPGVSTPPVATSLIAVAPARISSRTARRSPSGPSTSRANPIWCPCPPVIVSARPAARILGPASRPRSTPRATWITESPRPPRSRTVVTP